MTSLNQASFWSIASFVLIVQIILSGFFKKKMDFIQQGNLVIIQTYDMRKKIVCAQGSRDVLKKSGRHDQTLSLFQDAGL